MRGEGRGRAKDPGRLGMEVRGEAGAPRDAGPGCGETGEARSGAWSDASAR